MHVMLPLDPSPSASRGLQLQYQVSTGGWFESFLLIGVLQRQELGPGGVTLHCFVPDLHERKHFLCLHSQTVISNQGRVSFISHLMSLNACAVHLLESIDICTVGKV